MVRHGFITESYMRGFFLWEDERREQRRAAYRNSFYERLKLIREKESLREDYFNHGATQIAFQAAAAFFDVKAEPSVEITSKNFASVPAFLFITGQAAQFFDQKQLLFFVPKPYYISKASLEFFTSHFLQHGHLAEDKMLIAAGTWAAKLGRGIKE